MLMLRGRQLTATHEAESASRSPMHDPSSAPSVGAAHPSHLVLAEWSAPDIPALLTAATAAD